MKRSLRLLVALGLLLGLIWVAGSRDLLKIFGRLDLPSIIYLLGLSVILIWLSCIKWRLFIRAWGHDAPILQLMKIYTITYFYNLFAPSFLMGDVARSYHLGKRLENQKDAFVATFLERLTGLLAMVMLGTVFVGLGTTATKGVEIAILSAAAVTLLGTLICFSGRLFELSRQIAKQILLTFGATKLAAKFEKLSGEIAKAMSVARKDQLLFLKAMFWSVLFHFGTVLNTYVAALAIGWEAPDFAGLCVVVPLVLLVAIAPITPSGIGIQEGAFMFFLQRIGATQPEALAVALVLRAKNVITASVGYLLWLTLKPTATDKDKSQIASGSPQAANN